MAGQVIIPVSPPFIGQISTTGWQVPDEHFRAVQCVQGLPPGARYVRSFYDSSKDQVCLVFEHDSLPEVQWGEEIPRMTPVFRQELQQTRSERESAEPSVPDES